MKTWALLSLAPCLLGTATVPEPGFLATPAAPPEVTISGLRPLVDRPPPFPVVESFLAVNPTDPDNLLASAMSVSTEASVVYGSWDGGRSWERVNSPEGAFFPGGDPMLTFGGNGRAYVSTITPDFNVWRSDDGGRTWAGPARVGGEGPKDRQWITASPASGQGLLPLYATAKTVLARTSGPEEHVLITSVSRDGGKTFAEPTVLRTDSDFLHTPTDLAVRSDGTVLLLYLVHYERIPGGEGRLRGRYLLRLSADGGRSWSGSHPVAETIDAGNAGDWTMMLKGLSAAGLAFDESGGPFDGSAYVAWPKVLAGRHQIVAARSRDGGLTWSDPVRVNRGGAASNHSTPTVAVNRDGVVAVTWNDRRHDPDDECFRHYLAVSTDGGETFGAGTPVSEHETCPGARSRWLNSGETQGLAALPDGSLRMIWSVGDADDLRLWTAVARVR